MAGAVHRAVTVLLWTLVGVAKILALALLIEGRWVAAASALALTLLLVTLALLWRRRLT